MRPKERRDSGQNDLFRARLDQIVDLGHPLAKQNRELLRLANAPIHAVISLPIGSSGGLESHRAIMRAGKTLVLLDNAPSGLRPGVDYLGELRRQFRTGRNRGGTGFALCYERRRRLHPEL